MRYRTLTMTTVGLFLLVVCLMFSFSSQAADENSGNRAGSARNNSSSERQVSRISDESDNFVEENAAVPFFANRDHWSKRIFGMSFQNHGRWHSNDIGFPPLGDSLSQTIKLHRRAARPIRLLVYHYDFAGNSAVLNKMGQRQVASIARRMTKTDQPVIIQPSKNRDLDKARRLAILQSLEKLDINGVESRVIIKAVYYPRLLGTEAEQVNERRRLNQPFTGDETGGIPN